MTARNSMRPQFLIPHASERKESAASLSATNTYCSDLFDNLVFFRMSFMQFIACTWDKLLSCAEVRSTSARAICSISPKARLNKAPERSAISTPQMSEGSPAERRVLIVRVLRRRLIVRSYQACKPRAESSWSIREQQVVHVCATVEKAPRCLSSPN